MDDLLDLNWSSSSSSSTNTKPLAPTLLPSKPAASPSAFDFLAKSSGTTTNGAAPNYYPSNTPRPSSSQSTPLVKAPAPAPIPAKPKVSASTGGEDAFSSLLGMGGGSSSKNTNLTMAQKQAQMEDERRRKEEHEKAQFAGLGSWEQFGSGSGPSQASGSSFRTSNGISTSPPPLQPIPTRSGAAFDGLLKPTPVSRPASSSSGIRSPVLPASSSRAAAKSPLAWDDDAVFLTNTKPQPSSSSSTAKKTAPPPDPWDFDQLAAVEPVRPRNGTGGSGMRTPDPDFDFGEWKDMDSSRTASRSDNRSDGQSRAPDHNSHPHGGPTKASARPASPPPHVVGQIVEMGFSPAQARAALAKTPSGIDVQAALDGLLAQAFQSPPSPESGPEDLGEIDDEYVERQRIRREEEERERRRKRRQGPSRDAIAPRSQEERSRASQTAQERNGNGTPIQADQILAQASEIGQSVFTKATSLWNTGKERALKAYEEQKRVYEAQLAESKGQGQGRVKDGRPRWMVEAEERARDERGEGGAEPSISGRGFRDDDGEEVEQETVRRERPRANGNDDRKEGARRAPATDLWKERPRDDLLFGDDRGPGSSRSRKPVQPVRTPRAATPIAPLPMRTLVSADPSAVQSSLRHKTKGNEHFKLGRFTEAESSYSSAITHLPGGHLYLVPLYNNRAATRLKLGDSKGSAEDCTTVIDIIGPTYHPSKEAPLPADLGSEVKLAEAYVKAYTKRAQAWEMGEKWGSAVEDWGRVLGFDAALIGIGPVAGKTRNLAADGLRRAKQMLDGGSTSRHPAPTKSTTTPRPKPKAKPPILSKPAQVDRSAAVSSLRAAAKALEAEDQQRLALKDSVESRVNSWKAGKETNLRALLASLDTVLWDEVLAGGLKVGMHELITEKQVKIKYMKVIARLHPDKLDVNKTTVKQRMLASGAFGTLNEAWQAFNNA